MINEPDGLAGLFLKYNYFETKDLAKSFLTLTAGILTFSVAFAEKVIDFKNATRLAKLSLTGSWMLNVASIILCGLAICYNALAAGQAIYGDDFDSLAAATYTLMLGSGVAFVLALVALVIAAINSLMQAENAKP